MSLTATARNHRAFRFLVLLADGFKVPANTLAEAEAIQSRYAARGVSSVVRVA